MRFLYQRHPHSSAHFCCLVLKNADRSRGNPYIINMCVCQSGVCLRTCFLSIFFFLFVVCWFLYCPINHPHILFVCCGCRLHHTRCTTPTNDRHIANCIGQRCVSTLYSSRIQNVMHHSKVNVHQICFDVHLTRPMSVFWAFLVFFFICILVSFVGWFYMQNKTETKNNNK